MEGFSSNLNDTFTSTRGCAEPTFFPQHILPLLPFYNAQWWGYESLTAIVLVWPIFYNVTPVCQKLFNSVRPFMNYPLETTKSDRWTNQPWFECWPCTLTLSLFTAYLAWRRRPSCRHRGHKNSPPGTALRQTHDANKLNTHHVTLTNQITLFN